MVFASEGGNAVGAKLVRAVPNPAGKAPGQETAVRFRISNLNFFYGPKQAVFEVNLNIPTSKITALIGPSGCGKSTFLRTLNRMNDTIRNSRWSGSILLDGQDITKIHSLNRFTTTWPTVCASTATRGV
jgi:ABC-type bacteriocin/lantibiotic exporter with double-glycine peptidase domain